MPPRQLLLSLLFCVLGAAAQTFRTAVPYVVQGGKLIATVHVNGHPGRFLIDTGAPCCLSHTFARRVGISPGAEKTGSDSNGRTVRAALVVIDSLRLGATSFHQLQAMEWEEGNPTEQFGIDGILGYNLLRLGVAIFDARAQRLVFTNLDRIPRLAEHTPLPLVGDDRLACFEVCCSPASIDTVMFDTGAADFYEMSSRSYDRLRADTLGIRHLASARGILSLGAAGVEEMSLKHRLRIPLLALGSSLSPSASVFSNVSVITTSARLSRIGSELLRHGDVVIDYPRRRFYFLPHAAPSPPSAPRAAASSAPPPLADLYVPEWDVVLTVGSDGYLCAGIVWDATLPLRSGTRILAVNGQRFDAPLSLREATQNALLSMPGDTATLTFLHPATHQEATLTIRKR